MLELRKILNGPLEENCYLLSSPGAGQSLLIDPGSSPDLIREELQHLGAPPALILATHGHFDHVGAVAELAKAYGVPFACHEAELPILESAADMAAFYGLPCLPCPRPSRLLRGGDSLEVAGLRIKVLHTPGHTPGGVCYYHEDSGNLFSGDTLFRLSLGRSDFEGGDASQLLRSIREQILTLPDSTKVWPGHGEGTTVLEERRGNPFL